MATGRETHNDNVVIGSGEVFIDLENADGALQGERYIGDTVSCSIATTTERLTVFSGDGPVARKLVDKVTSQEQVINVVLRDMSMENLALMMGVEVSPRAIEVDNAFVVNDREINPTSFPSPDGVWITLGASDVDPHGVGKIRKGEDFKIGVADATVRKSDRVASSFQASKGTNKYGEVLVEGTDYEVDYNNGRVLIKNTDATIGKFIGIAYKKTAKPNNKKAAVVDIREVKGAIRYIEDTGSGKGRKVYSRRCSISASGETALKSRDTEQQITLACAVQSAGGSIPLLVIEGEDA